MNDKNIFQAGTKYIKTVFFGRMTHFLFYDKLFICFLPDEKKERQSSEKRLIQTKTFSF